MKAIHRENRENRVRSFERGWLRGCELSQLQTEPVSHVTSDEAIVPFRRLNSYEERNLRSAVEVAALVNGRALAFCAAEVKYFSPPWSKRRSVSSTIEGLLCNSVESSLLESTYRRENFLAMKKKRRATSNDRSIYPKLVTRALHGVWSIYRVEIRTISAVSGDI